MSAWLSQTPIAKIVTDHWVKDLHKTAAQLSSRYQLGPWKIAELKPPLLTEAEFRGMPVEVDILAAMCESGPLAIELLQVRGGSEPFMRWAQQMEDGYWHPVSYHRTVAAAEEALREFQQHGFEIVLSGRVAGSRFFMLDAAHLLGRMFEVAGGDLSDVDWNDGHESDS